VPRAPAKPPSPATATGGMVPASRKPASEFAAPPGRTSTCTGGNMNAPTKSANGSVADGTCLKRQRVCGRTRTKNPRHRNKEGVTTLTPRFDIGAFSWKPPWASRGLDVPHGCLAMKPACHSDLKATKTSLCLLRLDSVEHAGYARGPAHPRRSLRGWQGRITAQTISRQPLSSTFALFRRRYGTRPGFQSISTDAVAVGMWNKGALGEGAFDVRPCLARVGPRSTRRNAVA
jgi:hypothetical protein